MSSAARRALHWMPRVLGSLFILFISMFALDVFSEGAGFWETLGALLIHLLPSYLLIAVLAIAWRWERLGGALFFGIAVLFTFAFVARNFRWDSFLLLSGPPALIGVLFLLSSHYRWELHGQA